jgi:hypothetical protein
MLHDKPVEYWLGALHDPDVKLRKRAAEVLGNAGEVDPAIVPALAQAARDPDGRVRLPALVALVKSAPASEEAAIALQAASEDRDSKIRSFARTALERILAVK